MEKTYELTILIHPDLEADLEPALKKVREVITSAGGKISKEDIWGKKKLAYTIKDEDFAIYIQFDLLLPAQAPIIISNALNITDEVLRYLLVSLDEKTKKALEQVKDNQTESEKDESGEEG